MKFKYNGRIYNPSNAEKKLKKMGISINDIEIIKEEDVIEEPFTEKLFYYYNPNTGYSICSIYDNVIDGYEKLDKGSLDKIIKFRTLSK